MMDLSRQTGRRQKWLILLGLFLFRSTWFLVGLPVLAFTREQLPNGLTLVFEKSEVSERTSVCLLIRGGRSAEPPGKEGLSYLTVRLSLEPSDNDFLHQLMKTGSEARIASRGDFLLLTVDSLSSQFEATMKLLERSLCRPVFSGIRISNLKQTLRESQKKEKDDVDSYAEVALMSALFGPHGYGASAYGQADSLEAVKGQDVSSFHQKYFVGLNAVVAVVSNLDEGVIRKILNSTLGKLPRGERYQAEVPPPRLPEDRNIFIKKDTQTAYLAMGFPLPPLTPENLPLNHLLQNILGSSPESKLWPLRHKEKIGYEVGSRLTLQKGGGCFWIYLKTFPDKINEAREKLKMTIISLRQNSLSPEDLKMASQSYRLSLLMTKENKAKQAEAMAIYAGWDWPADFNEFILAKLEAVGLDEINAYVSSILDPDKAIFLQVGPEN